jgi:hypothetical protein
MHPTRGPPGELICDADRIVGDPDSEAVPFNVPVKELDPDLLAFEREEVNVDELVVVLLSRRGPLGLTAVTIANANTMSSVAETMNWTAPEGKAS